MVLHVPYGSRLFPFKFGSVASVIIIALLSCSVFGANGFPGNHTDRLAQLEFKAELVLLGALHLCSTTIHFRLWYGVTCGRRHHRVTVLDLHSNKLRGITSSSIENLTFLGFLNLPNSSFYSRIPEVGRLQRLQVFWFHNNLLDGLIPPDYLLNQWGMPRVHCDLKPNNVLLDNEMTARVGDLRLVRFLPEATRESVADPSSSIRVKGSVGYIAPGKRPIDEMFTDGLNLHSFAKAALSEQVSQVVDPASGMSGRAEQSKQC
ncbi:hypothetical protein CDL15_Pgr005186 [Punica granatum]|uniref:Protein kinase domain-containing protein n=1 Tax=Punica granatum TaxID=22663 RepID=A0A218WPP1_PUNGR|nr:hypothetical protein CDL15_Pgr005186 [Punica granatum]